MSTDTSFLLAKIEELKPNLQINLAAIENDLMKQPQLFDEVGELYATCVAHRDSMKAELDELDAQLGTNIRTEALQDGTKITETRIEELILTNPNHKQMMTDFINSKLIAEKAQALRDSFSQRSSMLRDLTTLQAGGLIGNPFRSRQDKYDDAKSRLEVARINRNQ